MGLAIGLFLTLMTYASFVIHPVWSILQVLLDLIILCIATIFVKETLLPMIKEDYKDMIKRREKKKSVLQEVQLRQGRKLWESIEDKVLKICDPEIFGKYEREPENNSK